MRRLISSQSATKLAAAASQLLQGLGYPIMAENSTELSYVLGFAVVSWLLWKFVLSPPPPARAGTTSSSSSSGAVRVSTMDVKGMESSSAALDECANCGKGDNNSDFKLKKCNACYLVKYCNVECQKAHRPKHKKECRKRAAELKDIALFSEGHNHHLEDCPMCLMPMPIDGQQSMLYFCCMKNICTGCALKKRSVEHGSAQVDISKEACPFCRSKISKDQRKNIQIIQRRVDAGDPEAHVYLGDMYNEGKRGLPVDKTRAVELWTEAARLGSVSAHFQLYEAYNLGARGVDRNMKLATHHAEIAAKGGHTIARQNLGSDEANRGNYKRALKHWMIAAKIGCHTSLANILDLYKYGDATKDDYADALTGFQKADEERTSPDRKSAVEMNKRMNRLMAGTVLSSGTVVKE